MKRSNRNGYATILTIVTIGILSILILGILNLHFLNHKIIRSNESSIKAYYLGESGAALLKNEVDNTFELFFDEYVVMLESEETITESAIGENNLHQKNEQSFKNFDMGKNEVRGLERVQQEEDVFDRYTDPHGWRLEVVYDENEIRLYATGHYRKARKRIVSIISYPNVTMVGEGDEKHHYQYVPSEILIYYQGYEGDFID